MENFRLGSYGLSAERAEDEVLLQLHGLKDTIRNETGFGSYSLIHTYTKTNQDGSFTYSIPYMTQDLAYALSPEFDSQIIVPYSAMLLVDRPGYTSTWQKETYVPEAAVAWNTVRFHDGWENIEDLELCDETLGRSNDLFSWSMPDEAAWFELAFTTNSTFATTNVTLMPTTNQLELGTSGLALDLETNIYWRIRGQYEVLDIENDGSVSSTDVYDGAWSTCDSGFVIEDSDGDGLPDYWEEQYLSTLAWGPTNDVDSDGLNNWGEYVGHSHPSNASSAFASSAESGDEDQFVFSWPSAPGRTYAVYRSTNLLNGFTSHESGIPATPPENVYTDSISNVREYYYNVEVGH
jgi:hypothetical protein